MSDKAKWVWMPHSAHFICGHDCRFHLATMVGDYIVSTVGEYEPDGPVREILAACRNVTLEGRGDARRADYMRKVGYEDIGLDRKYETMVFRAIKCEDGNLCCPFRIESGEEVDFAGYNEPAAAYEGHLILCEKWSSVKAPAKESKHDDR